VPAAYDRYLGPMLFQPRGNNGVKLGLH